MGGKLGGMVKGTVARDFWSLFSFLNRTQKNYHGYIKNEYMNKRCTVSNSADTVHSWALTD